MKNGVTFQSWVVKVWLPGNTRAMLLAEDGKTFTARRAAAWCSASRASAEEMAARFHGSEDRVAKASR